MSECLAFSRDPIYICEMIIEFQKDEDMKDILIDYFIWQLYWICVTFWFNTNSIKI